MLPTHCVLASPAPIGRGTRALSNGMTVGFATASSSGWGDWIVDRGHQLQRPAEIEVAPRTRADDRPGESLAGGVDGVQLLPALLAQAQQVGQIRLLVRVEQSDSFQQGRSLLLEDLHRPEQGQ